MLGWFDAQRRGYHVNGLIERALSRYGLRTQPDFRYAYIDSKIDFVPATSGDPADTPPGVSGRPTTDVGDGGAVSVEAPEAPADPVTLIVTTVGGATGDPTYRIGKLPAANTPPVSVKPNGTLGEAVTLMLTHDFSQLPVM